ncbi:MAG: sulfotransferase [Chloroflexaceae bacterium]|nr:sulfotransferase [Chloroflexaceae bacterium]
MQEFLVKSSGRKGFVFKKIGSTLDALATYQSFTRPIFIISPPRSGSTLLFECLSRAKNIYYLQYEADRIWWNIFPYRNMKEPSDYIDLKEIDAEKLKKLRKRTYQEATKYFRDKLAGKAKFTYKLGIERIRYLDKTIANCFHLDVIDRAFPGAQYLFLVRDPRANISSMMDGWGKAEFSKPQLNQIISKCEQKTVEVWTYPAPSGWQNILHYSLAQICAWSWQQHIEFALAFLGPALSTHSSSKVRRFS